MMSLPVWLLGEGSVVKGRGLVKGEVCCEGGVWLTAPPPPPQEPEIYL